MTAPAPSPTPVVKIVVPDTLSDILARLKAEENPVKRCNLVSALWEEALFVGPAVVDAALVPPLKELLAKDPEVDVRRMAAMVLGKVSSCSSLEVVDGKIVPALIDALEVRIDVNLRVWVLKALDDAGCRASPGVVEGKIIPALAKAMLDVEEPEVSRTATEILGKMRQRSFVIWGDEDDAEGATGSGEKAGAKGSTRTEAPEVDWD